MISFGILERTRNRAFRRVAESLKSVVVKSSTCNASSDSDMTSASMSCPIFRAFSGLPPSNCFLSPLPPFLVALSHLVCLPPLLPVARHFPAAATSHSSRGLLAKVTAFRFPRSAGFAGRPSRTPPP